MTLRLLAFDSGVGGLTAIAPWLSSDFDVEIFYLADLINLPYGQKSSDRIRNLTRDNLKTFSDHLRSRGIRCDAGIIACHTASSHFQDSELQELGEQLGIPLTSVLQPLAKKAADAGKPILVLATPATVRGGAFSREISRNNPILQVREVACPLFVPLVEDQVFDGEILRLVAQKYLGNQVSPGTTVILGCTHYPFLRPALERLYPHLFWIDAGDAVFESMQPKLGQIPKGRPRLRFFSTDFVEDPSKGKQPLLAFLKMLNIESTLSETSFLSGS